MAEYFLLLYSKAVCIWETNRADGNEGTVVVKEEAVLYTRGCSSWYWHGFRGTLCL